MDKSLCIGVAIGMVAGALLTANSCKVRRFVCEGQKQMKSTVGKMTEKKDDTEVTKEE